MTATELAARLHEHRPIIDAVLDVVLCDCPSCGVQDTDPLGLWRPLRVTSRGDAVTFWCTSCDVRREVRCV